MSPLATTPAAIAQLNRPRRNSYRPEAKPETPEQKVARATAAVESHNRALAGQAEPDPIEDPLQQAPVPARELGAKPLSLGANMDPDDLTGEGEGVTFPTDEGTCDTSFTPAEPAEPAVTTPAEPEPEPAPAKKASKKQATEPVPA